MLVLGEEAGAVLALERQDLVLNIEAGEGVLALHVDPGVLAPQQLPALCFSLAHLWSPDYLAAGLRSLCAHFP